MLEKDNTEVADQKISLNNDEKLVFHYENGVSYTEENPTVRDRLESFFSKKTMKTGMLFVLSALLLCFAFLPWVTVDELEVDSKAYSFSFSCVECIDLSVKYFYSLSDEELMKTELAQEVLHESKAVSGDLLKKQVYLTAMSEDTPVNVTVILLGVVSLLYMGVCALALLVFLVKFIAVVVPKFEKIFKLPRRLHNADSLFCLLFCVMPAMLFIALQACRVFQNDTVALWGSSATEGLAFGAVLSMILSFVGVVVICLEKLLDLTQKSEWLLNQKLISHSVCGVLVLALILSVFLSCFTINVSTDSSKQEMEVSYDYLNFTEISESRVDYYTNLSQGDAYTELLEYVQENDHNTVNSNEGAAHIMGLLSVGYSGFPVNALYIMLTVLLLTILLLSGILLWSILQNIFGKTKSCRGINRLRVILLVCVGIYFLLLMVFNAWINLFLSEKIPNMLSMSLGVAPVMMLVAVVGTMFFSFNNTGKEENTKNSNKK